MSVFIPSSGGGIKSIQRGTISIGAASASATATITAVNTAKASVNFLNFNYNSGNDASHYSAHLVLTNSTTVTATRINTTGIVIVSYEVIEAN